jgi:hypothetical protein
MLTEEEWVDGTALFSPSTTAQITTRSANFDILIEILSEALTHFVRLLAL